MRQQQTSQYRVADETKIVSFTQLTHQLKSPREEPFSIPVVDEI